MNKTSIEWTDLTWNPIRANLKGPHGPRPHSGTFCTRISPGCTNCYASVINRRFGNGLEYTVPNLERVEFFASETILAEPLTRRKPAKIFVGDMFDLFHESISYELLDPVFAVIALAQEHIFQILTKRADRMRLYLESLPDRAVPVSLAITRNAWWDGPHSSPCAAGTIEERLEVGPLVNVHAGVSVEDQKRADERVTELLATPAAVRFLSVEPQLEAIDLVLGDAACNHPSLDGINQLDGPEKVWRCGVCRGHFMFDGLRRAAPAISWVICGGESGPGARPFNLAWAESLLAQCRAAGVPFFMKQTGANFFCKDCANQETHFCGLYKPRDRKGGDPAEWPESLRVREFPATKIEVPA
jgi:protein gp37